MMLQSKLDVLTTTALQSDTIYGELGSLKKKERTNSILYGPALLLLLAACGGGGGGGGTVSVSSPEPADTDDTPAEDVRVKVGAGPADADGVHRATTDSAKIDIDAEAIQPENLSAIYKSGDDGADITLEFVDQQNQLSHVFTISNVDDGDLDITVDNKALFIKFGEDDSPTFADDLSGSNNYASFLDGGQGDDALSGGVNEHNLFGFSGNEFGNDTIVNPSPKSEGYINSGDIISFINFVLRRPTDDVELREGLSLADLVTPGFEGENLVLSTNNGSSVTVNNGAYLDIGIRSSHGNVENFIYALSSPVIELRGTELPDIIFGRGGNDEIKGLAGNDEIIGGAGTDTIDAGYGDDYIEGGAGADNIDGSFGIDTASYINSEQAVQVDLSDDNAESGGDAEGDVLRNIENLIGSTHDDTLTGDAGPNKIEGHEGDDTIYGLGGNDELHGGEDRDTIYGGSGEDTIYGDEGDDILFGDDQADTIYGGDGKDTIEGGSGADTLYGEADGDIIRGNEGEDTAFGGVGADTIEGGDDADTLYGEAGEDIIYGGDGEDTIEGGSGADTLSGDGGVNILEGAGGSDTFTGGAGNDVFVAYIQSDMTDIITDFTDGDKVRIDVDDPSAIADLASLYAALSITATNNTDHTNNGADDTVLRFDRGATGDAGDYLIVFEGFTDALDINDFDII